ncbi:Zn-dependent hydrolase [Devosia neptuniae]|jgi:N-carbamoyl-L-amino-acid hydrolase|uniref:Zn-dependent hydrolase n=1 Tax=Devosia TaxID=46913 RepID=UPI0022AE8050|nr:Zn-dependent hydrolase [Devosia neptuniae]MCZ4344814.1 Zn-dependent hydrolase [Devosia neptuniae]|tara:strand:- start:978 stop:2231 length:1254 start_codon:yes stop_codon:yes gene_type:complete
MNTNSTIRARRIADDIDALAGITEPDRPYTRRAFTPKFLEGRKWLEQAMRDAGAVTQIDAAGNLIGTIPGAHPDLGTIMLGSHSDTVPDGGRFDGIAGVIAALEVVRALRDQGTVLDHTLEVADFLAEEVSIFGVSCIGSRGMTGSRPPEWLQRVAGGLTLKQAIADVGGHPLHSAERDDIKAFLELHIEQGPVLQNEKIDIGVVTAIAGITRIEIIVEGRADHAGTTPMGARKDALTTAAWIALGVEELAKALASGEAHFAATVGEFEMTPNAANVVPARVRMLIDARAERREDMERFVDELDNGVGAIAAKTGVAVSAPRMVSDNLPTPGDADLLDVLDAACETAGASHRRMASGAGHDTAWMARITKAAMIFVPCVDGRSHAPDELAIAEDIALGAAVLLDSVMALDTKLQEDI